MNEFALIADLALIWGVALVVGYICIRLKQPVIAGYMLAGVVLGPHGLKLISRADHIGFLSEFGVAMMLFALGVDLSLKQVVSSAKRIVSAGLVQMLLTISAAVGLSYFFHVATSMSAAIMFGCICAISSSVVISRLLVDRGESDSIHGQILLPLSLVQDLALVAIIPFMPILQNGQADPMLILFSFLKAAGFILAVIVGSIKIVPYVLSKAANSNSREIFMLTILVLCLGVALLSEKAGLSIALGAFLAGIMMSESTYAHQALHDVSPLKDVFSTIFFVSVGLLLDPVFVFQHAFEVLCFVVILILGKALIGTLAALLATKNLRSAIFVGAGLAQIGEFSFVLLTLGHDSKIVSDAMYNLLLAGSVLTMMLSPALMALVPKLLVRRMESSTDFPLAEQKNALQSGLNEHVVICGFGRIGSNLGLVLEAQQIPFVVIELNAGIIEELALRGIPHIYGDAMSPYVLAKANLKRAACLVLTVPDALSATAVARLARKQNQKIRIIARAHREDDIRTLQAASVNAVVQPEFEASIEVTRLMLHVLNRPLADVQRALEQIRTQRYGLISSDTEDLFLSRAYAELNERQMGIWFKVENELADAKTIQDINIRQRTGATITAVKRGSKTFGFPEASFELTMGDELYAVGSFEQLRDFKDILGFAALQAAL